MFSISSGRGDFPSPTRKRMKVIINQGGGVFGYIITNFMSYLDFDLYGKVDVVAGTSVGGILALAYCVSQDYAGLNRLFRAASRRIFSDRRLLLFSSCRYGDRDLRAFLQELFGDRTLSDVRGVYALVTATDYTLKMPRVFDNINLTEEDDISLVDLGLYTSAAPTFFPARRHVWRGGKAAALNERLLAAKAAKASAGGLSGSVIMDGGILENIPIISTYTTLRSELGARPEDLDVFVIRRRGPGGEEAPEGRGSEQVERDGHAEEPRHPLRHGLERDDVGLLGAPDGLQLVHVLQPGEGLREAGQRQRDARHRKAVRRAQG